MFRVSLVQVNVQVGDGRWLFQRRHRDRFEWIALLAYRRATQSQENGWVTRDDIARLPKWSGKTRKHIGDNVARYLQDLRQGGFDPVEVNSPWTGPYRLNIQPEDVSFDLPIEDVAKALCITPVRPEIQRDDLIRFVPRFVRAELLFQHGGLISGSPGGRLPSAYKLTTDLVRDYPANARLQLIAVLAVVRVLFRLGRFGVARETLIEYEGLVKKAGDPVLDAQYHLNLAWSYLRAETSTEANRKYESCLSKARESATRAGDRASLGLIAYRNAWFYARKKHYDEALTQMLSAVEAAVITSNFSALQSYCADFGSILHRAGLRHYEEARRWILTSVLLARSVRIGRDDAHGEMILGKMYSEMGNRRLTAALWLDRAERIAKSAGNAVNLADVHMVRAFWHRQYGAREDLIETLAVALNEFRSLSGFDSRQKEKYMMLEFPSVWLQVLAFARRHKSDSF